MSKRAPNAEAVRVRRATLPSTPSRMSATLASATSTATGTCRTNESTVSAVTPPTRTARVSVTRSAGPSDRAPQRCRPYVTAAQTTIPYAAPTTQPAGPRPAVTAKAASRAAWPINPMTGPVRNAGTMPPYV